MEKRFFIGGFTWDGESQLERFLKDNIWENGYDEKFQDVYDKIKIGDYFALKSTYYKGKSYLRIYNIGQVEGKSTEAMKLNIKWDKNYVKKDITDISWYANTLCQITDIEHIKRIFNMDRSKEQITESTSLLTSNHNLILTGAPGTGKTYLAKQIAKAMGCADDEIGFVQFHPSYDYTDFVEGLRPVQDDDGKVGFKRKDGVFKEFCKRALKNSRSGSVDNFDEVWDKLIGKLNNETSISVPMLSGRNSITIELNVTGSGLAERTYENQSQVGQKTWIDGQSKFFSKDQLYKIYKGGKGVPSGGHDNYRKAIVNYMIENLGLIRYDEGTFNQEETQKNFVFIIDEINRGEMSKIFGELFFSIDPGYRGIKGKVKTQYQNLIEEDDDEFYDGFYVPENVYIIGTINDIDRSVESMDFAFRRRFAFKEIKAEDRMEMLDDAENGIPNYANEAKNRMKNLNSAIEKIEGLSSAYHVGPAYFLKLKNYDGNFQQLWENHLEGLLREYLRGMPNVEEKIGALKKAYDLNTAQDESTENNG